MLTKVARLLAQTERTSVPERRAILALELREHLERSAGCLGTEMELRVREVVQAEGLPLPVHECASLPAGKTFVLLFHPTRPQVGWLRMDYAGGPGIRSLGFSGRARKALDTALEGLASYLHENLCGFPEAVFGRGLAVTIDTLDMEGVAVDGPSLGLASAVAALSCFLGCPPLPDVAGTAEVGPSGLLSSVTHVENKSSALHVQFPQVRRLVVAADQDVSALPPGLELVRCRSLAEALPQFGLAARPDVLPPPSIKDIRGMLTEFQNKLPEANSTEIWRQYSERATVVALTPQLSPTERASAWGWAALFALHAGDLAAEERFRKRIDPAIVEGLAPPARTWLLIGNATALIDRGETAQTLLVAREALTVARRELHKDELRILLGRAYGTLGRAHLHAGSYRRALPALSLAAEFHASHLEEEEARSRVYQATCLRLLERVPEALETVALGFRRARCAGHKEGITNELFLLLERGRCRLANADWELARRDFELVIERQSSDRDYPRISAIRGLTIALRNLGLSQRADESLARVLAVAEDPTFAQNSMLPKVAALGCGEALLDFARMPSAGPSRHMTEHLRAVFSKHHTGHTLDEIERAIRRFVY